LFYKTGMDIVFTVETIVTVARTITNTVTKELYMLIHVSVLSHAVIKNFYIWSVMAHTGRLHFLLSDFANQKD